MVQDRGKGAAIARFAAGRLLLFTMTSLLAATSWTAAASTTNPSGVAV